MKLALLIILFPFFVMASIDIAFIEVKSFDGKILQLEPGGQFAHIAMSYQGKWMHSHPHRGVEIISREILEKMGVLKAIIRVSEASEPNSNLVNELLGKPYDGHYSWSNEAYYCSELVAKILKIDPQPMEFKAAIWPEQFQALRGESGISPDDIFNILKQRGYNVEGPAPLCSKIIKN